MAEIDALDLSDPPTALAVLDLQRTAYVAEAELIGFYGIPAAALRREYIDGAYHADPGARARIRALRRGTSVNALVREFLEAYVCGSGPEQAIAGLLDIGDRSVAGAEGSGRDWARDDIYAERSGH